MTHYGRSNTTKADNDVLLRNKSIICFHLPSASVWRLLAQKNREEEEEEEETRVANDSVQENQDSIL